VTGSLHSVFHSTPAIVTRDLLLACAVVFWLGFAFWTFRDARRRIDDWWLVGTATLIGLVPLLGPLAYLVFRPPETLADVHAREVEVRALEARLARPEPHCPVCRSAVEASFLVCPVCTTQLKQPCASCRAPLEPLWQVCPYCMTPAGAVAVDLDSALAAEAATVAHTTGSKPRKRTSRRATAS
jgi:double zinc ribbon protein